MSDKIVSESGEIHIEDEEVDLSRLSAETWAAIGLLWLLGATVFHQFFTRYALNDSAAWTDGSGYPGQAFFKKHIVTGILSAMGKLPFCS